MCKCSSLAENIEYLKVEEISDLAPYLTKVHTDSQKWETTFECKDCGQKWIEKYLFKGHGQTPIVEKIGIYGA